jgi:hypothetical protein
VLKNTPGESPLRWAMGLAKWLVTGDITPYIPIIIPGWDEELIGIPLVINYGIVLIMNHQGLSYTMA